VSIKNQVKIMFNLLKILVDMNNSFLLRKDMQLNYVCP